MKKVILSMDVEDWYHLDYFNRNDCNTNESLIDGLDIYVDLLDRLSLPSSFFVLGEIAEKKIEYFKDLAELGHDIGSHGWNHERPLAMPVEVFRDDINRSLNVMKKINNENGTGYRAPCFSLDRERLEIIRDSGFIYDSSLINFDNHPLYGSIDMSGFKCDHKYIYQLENFIEFEVTTTNFLNKRVPISGGGYLRLFPWIIMKNLISKHLHQNEIFILYIHPFELSNMPLPKMPSSTSSLTKFRFSHGRGRVVDKIKRVIDMLDSYGYEFTTFKNIRNEIINSI